MFLNNSFYGKVKGKLNAIENVLCTFKQIIICRFGLPFNISAIVIFVSIRRECESNHGAISLSVNKKLTNPCFEIRQNHVIDIIFITHYGHSNTPEVINAQNGGSSNTDLNYKTIV